MFLALRVCSLYTPEVSFEFIASDSARSEKAAAESEATTLKVTSALCLFLNISSANHLYPCRVTRLKLSTTLSAAAN